MPTRKVIKWNRELLDSPLCFPSSAATDAQSINSTKHTVINNILLQFFFGREFLYRSCFTFHVFRRTKCSHFFASRFISVDGSTSLEITFLSDYLNVKYLLSAVWRLSYPLSIIFFMFFHKVLEQSKVHSKFENNWSGWKIRGEVSEVDWNFHSIFWFISIPKSCLYFFKLLFRRCHIN